MNFLGMGPMELMLILVLALIVFGPGKLPEVAGQVGKAVRDMRRATSDLSGEFNRTLSLELEEKRDADASKAAATLPVADTVPVAPAAVGSAAVEPASILAAPAEAAAIEPAPADAAPADPVAVASAPSVPALSDSVTSAPEVSVTPGTESVSEVVVGTEPPTAAPTTQDQQQALSVSASDLADAPAATSAADLPSPRAPLPTVVAPAADAPTVAATEPPLADTTDWHWEEPWSAEPEPIAPGDEANVLAADTPPASMAGAPRSSVQAPGQSTAPVSPARPQDTPASDGTLAERGAGQPAGPESARPERPAPA